MTDNAGVKLLDRRMLATEKRDLCPTHISSPWDRWTLNVEPFDFEIVEPWGFEEAARRFLDRWNALTVGRAQGVLTDA
jgi:hypothetical protein